MKRISITALTCALILANNSGRSAHADGSGPSSDSSHRGAPGRPYLDAPEIAPIGVRIGRYSDIPEAARGPAIDSQKGYRTQALGGGLYLVTDNVYQAMFLVHETGVVVVDAPQSLGAAIPKAIAEVTPRPITHLIYSHAHADHIGAARSLGGHPIIIAHDETRRLLARAADENRPVPTKTFTDHYTLHAGSQVLELSYHGNGHEPGNIFIYAPAQKTLMVVDVVFPGWMMWRRLALAQDVPGYLAQIEELRKLPFETLVTGHVARVGTRADVELQAAFLRDLKAAASQGLKSTKMGEEMDAADTKNPWAVFDNYIDRVVVKCVNELTPRWRDKLAAFDVYIWDQCYTMEQSLRID